MANRMLAQRVRNQICFTEGVKQKKEWVCRLKYKRVSMSQNINEERLACVYMCMCVPNYACVRWCDVCVCIDVYKS